MGSSIAMLIAFILPCLFYLRIRKHKPWRFKKLAALFVLLAAMLMGIQGVSAAADAMRRSNVKDDTDR